jgi:hypothetical protein
MWRIKMRFNSLFNGERKEGDKRIKGIEKRKEG